MIEGIPLDLRNIGTSQRVLFLLDISIEPTGCRDQPGCGPASVANRVNLRVHRNGGQVLDSDKPTPSPSEYSTAGLGFCLMSHIVDFLIFSDIKVCRAQIEIRGSFSSGPGLDGINGDTQGEANRFEASVLIDSDEPLDGFGELSRVCKKAAVASQAIASPIPISVNLIINGKKFPGNPS